MYPTYGEGSQEPHPDSPAAMNEDMRDYPMASMTMTNTVPQAAPSTTHAEFHEQEVELMQQILDSVSRLENRTDAFLDQHYADNDSGPEENAGYASRWEECHAIRMELLNRIGQNVEQITRRFRA